MIAPVTSDPAFDDSDTGAVGADADDTGAGCAGAPRVAPVVPRGEIGPTGETGLPLVLGCFAFAEGDALF